MYLAETNTSLYRRFCEDLGGDLFECSEYFGDAVAPGAYVDGFRHENFESTSFQSASFDLVITSDVMEHVSDAIAAEREIVRLLKPSGLYVFTAPLDPMGPEDIVLSIKQPDGTIVHLGEPVYHGDPNRPERILAYRIFALRALERRFLALGCSFTTYRVWSQDYGVLGPDSWVHVVQKGS